MGSTSLDQQLPFSALQILRTNRLTTCALQAAESFEGNCQTFLRRGHDGPTLGRFFAFCVVPNFAFGDR